MLVTVREFLCALTLCIQASFVNTVKMRSFCKSDTLLNYEEIFYQLIEVDQNYVFNKPCKEIVDVLKIIVPALTKVISLKWKERSGICSNSLKALQVVEHYVTGSLEKVDRQIMKRIKLSKNLVDLIYWEFTHSYGNLEESTHILRSSFITSCARWMTYLKEDEGL